MPRYLRTSALAVAALSMVLVGCSDDDEPSACGELQDLAEEVRELRDMQVVQDGTTAVSEQLDSISESWGEAKSVAGDQFGDEFDAVESAVADVRDALPEIDSPESLSDASAGLRDALDQLAASVSSELGDCDLSADD